MSTASRFAGFVATGLLASGCGSILGIQVYDDTDAQNGGPSDASVSDQTTEGSSQIDAPADVVAEADATIDQRDAPEADVSVEHEEAAATDSASPDAADSPNSSDALSEASDGSSDADACGTGGCCTNACSSGATRCASTSMVETCAAGSNGCTQWGAPALCPGGFTCSGTSCLTSCSSNTQCAPSTPFCNTATGHCVTGPAVFANVSLTGKLFEETGALYGTEGGHATTIDLQSAAVSSDTVASITGLGGVGPSFVFGIATSGNPLYSFATGTLSVATLLDAGTNGTIVTAAVSGAGLWAWQTDPAAAPFLVIYTIINGSAQANSNTSMTTAGCEAVAGDSLGIIYALAMFDSMGLSLPCTMFAASPSGANPLSLALPNGANPTVMGTDQTTVYWYNSTDGKLYSSARNGNGFAAMVGNPLAHAPIQLAVDASDVYWTDGTAGTVSAVPIGSAGATPLLVAGGQSGAAGIVVDSTAIYWVTSSSVMKLAK
jgi:hypothetical protein